MGWLDNGVRRTREFYGRLLTDFRPYSSEALGWTSAENQRMRYWVLSLVGELDDKKLLDVGCGFGQFFGFLLDQGIHSHYVGCDIIDEMILRAREKFPSGAFGAGDFFGMEGENSVDYAVASGTFNLKFYGDDTYIYQAIEHLFYLAKIGIAFNLLSSYTRPAEQDTQTFRYYDPEKIFSHCKKRSEYVTLKHDYLPHDFTIYMYK